MAKLTQALFEPPPIIYENNGGESGHSFRKDDAVVMHEKLILKTTHTTEICIVVKICNGWITIKDSNNTLYLVDSMDITCIGYKTNCVIAKNGDILLNL